MNNNVVRSYKDLIVWQKSILLVKMIYQLTRVLPDEEKFGLTSQMRRSSVSVPSNIAEGSRRRSKKDFRNFLRIAQGSLSELETQLIICGELNFISKEQPDPVESIVIEISKMLTSMIKGLET